VTSAVRALPSLPPPSAFAGSASRAEWDAICSRQGSTAGFAITWYEQGMVVDVPVSEPLVQRA
jgi:hypothetical protein